MATSVFTWVVLAIAAIPMAHPSLALPCGTQAAQPQSQPAFRPAPQQSHPGNGVISPILLKEVKPTYTEKARRAGIEGTVLLEAVVLPNGKVGKVNVTRSLDREFGLDKAAVKALKKWRFKPGTKDGVAVPVLVEVEMTFQV